MSVPDYQSLMLPALKALADGIETPLSEVRARVEAAEGLTPEDMHELLPGGRQTVFANRVGWAVISMRRAGLLERVRRGVYRLTAEGERLLAKAPSRIDRKFLRNYPAYREWTLRRKHVQARKEEPAPVPPDDAVDTPEEVLGRVVQQLREELETEVLDRVRKAEPAFLERVGVDLLLAMGYGGGDPKRGQVTGRSGDGGIDGKILEDALGLDAIYLQAKRYDGKNVSAKDLRDFAGAIDVAGMSKGVFVTTAGFARGAENYVKQSSKRIILIDGDELTRLMVRYNIGVRQKEQYEVKRIDENYFDPEEF